MKKQELIISGMTCAACSGRIERKLGKTEGVAEAVVNLAGEKATFTFDPDIISETEIIDIIEKILDINVRNPLHALLNVLCRILCRLNRPLIPSICIAMF